MRPFHQVHVCVEHVFAALKGRFQSLCELHLQIHLLKDLRITVYWVQCCLILHNMMIRFEEKLQLQSTESWAIQEDVDKGGVGQVAVQVEEGTPGQHF